MVQLPSLLHGTGRNRGDRILLDGLASGEQGHSLPGPKIRISTPRTKTCPRGPRTWGTLLPSRQKDVLLTELDSIACGSQLCSLPGAPSVAAKTDDLQSLCDSLAVSTAIFALLRRRTTAGSIRAFLWIIHKPPSCLCSGPFVPRTHTYDAKIKRKDCSRGAPFFRAFCEGVRDYETSHARSSFRDLFRGWGLRLNRCLSPHPK